MTVDTRTLMPEDFPPLLLEIPDPPELLHVRGTLPNPKEYCYLTIVGSRKYTEYGERVTKHLISHLKGHPICIVSGLALGIDTLAHIAALETGLPTLAIPGSGLSDDVLYPKSHRHIAAKILQAGGALLSEYDNDFKATSWSFPKRNRIKAGISHATLIIEAEEKSGTLITARLANEYNRDVLTVPGSLFSPTSAGVHYLIKNGATPVRSATDILEILNLHREDPQGSLFETFSDEERELITLLKEPQTKDEIMRTLSIPPHRVEGLIQSLVSKKVIRERLGRLERYT